MHQKILAVDDDPVLLQLITEHLQAAGYEVVVASNGEDGLRLLADTKPHLVVLDVMMPNLDGFQTCKRMRQVSTVPIIMLTARSSHEDIVQGLHLGADDYLSKPFNSAELIARVQAVLRRTSMPPPSESAPLRFGNGNLVIDPGERRVLIEGVDVDMTPTEFELLLFMAHNPGRILRTEVIFENVWSYDADANIESVKWYIWRLRRKIEKNPSKPQYIITERGVGYRFVPHYSMTERGGRTRR